MEAPMRINHKILSIPPYVSTSWKNIASLHLEDARTHLVLVITLHNGARIMVPNLQGPMIESIFAAHAKFMEQEAAPMSQPLTGTEFAEQLRNLEQMAGISFTSDGEGIGMMMQHNPQQADTPDLPEAVLKKIGSLVKAMGIDDPTQLPKAEEDCNCPHCQISRALQSALGEEEVSEKDLTFRDAWTISSIGENLYDVTNTLEPEEKYRVFLGDPIGCTCGTAHCDHVRAVLQT